MRSPVFLKPLAVGCMMNIIQQVTGITARVSKNSEKLSQTLMLPNLFFYKFVPPMKAILFYSTTMFTQAGMENPKMGTAILGGITTFVSILTIVVIDRFGRKVLMLGSITGQLIASVVIGGVLVSMKNLENNPEVLSIVSVVFIYIFVISFQLGVAPIPSFISAELFEVSER